MKRKRSFTALTLCAALLLSGCNAGTPAPAVSESETATASDITTVEVTTTTTTGATTTVVTTTAEPVKPKPPVSITAEDHKDYRHIDYDNGNFVLCMSKSDSSDHIFEGEYTRPETAEPCEQIEFTVPSEKVTMYLRESCGGFSGRDGDIKDRVQSYLYKSPEEFVSAYDIKPKDAVIVGDIKLVTEKNIPDLTNLSDITIGYTIDEPVNVNAFVCGYGEDVKVLIDPCYMYGLPLLSLADTEYMFGYAHVLSDSLLFTGTLAEGLAPGFESYAYASVALTNVDVTYSRSAGYMNTCTVTDINIIDEFEDIRFYNISENDTVISNGEKDPTMQEMFNAIIASKDEIYSENTFGIVLLDLDFDGTPELLSTTITSNENYHPYFNQEVCETRIFRFTDSGLKYIDSLYPIYSTGNSDGKYIALTELPDGRKAWAITKRFELPIADEYGWDVYYYAYQYTLEGDTLTEYPVYTAEYKVIDENAKNEWDRYEITYYYRGEKMDIAYRELDPPEDTNGEYPDHEYSWNGISTSYGTAGTVVYYAMEDFFSTATESYALMSNWLGYTDNGLKAYDLSPREFAHHIAYMVDSWFYGGVENAEHQFVFVGAFAKPVIYLYPEEETDVSVQVNFPLGGELTCTYPEYNDGWNVTAMPDGTLYDANGDEYYCLYWEGVSRDVMSDAAGFCVAGADTAAFLREKLMYIGLTAREANEFIIYWLPKMQANPYNVITLHTADYAASVPLDVSPTPDTQIRVFMTYYASDTPVDIPEQDLPHYERTGFTLVEWGGSEG